GNSEVPYFLGLIARREGRWGESVDYFERALALDPRNLKLLVHTAEHYGILRQFPAALKLYDRALEITPDDPDVMAAKASIYLAQGNLREAAKFLSEINGQSPNAQTFHTKFVQLRLERNYGQTVRFVEARLAQFHFASEIERAFYQLNLAFMQRLAGDTAGAKLTAEQARTTLERPYRKHPDRSGIAIGQ